MQMITIKFRNRENQTILTHILHNVNDLWISQNLFVFLLFLRAIYIILFISRILSLDNRPDLLRSGEMQRSVIKNKVESIMIVSKSKGKFFITHYIGDFRNSVRQATFWNNNGKHCMLSPQIPKDLGGSWSRYTVIKEKGDME